MPIFSPIWLLLLALASPSLWLIKTFKHCIPDRKIRTYVQRTWSAVFAIWAAGVTLVLIYDPQWIVADGDAIPVIVVGTAVSRIVEIVHGFYKDAFNKIDVADPSSEKTEGEPGTIMRVVERLRWLGISYAENILSFAILFFLEPCAFVKAPDMASLPMSDLLYFSVMTITTTGYGDITPATSGARVLSGAEALSGVLLLVLVLAAYLSTISGWAAGYEGAATDDHAGVRLTVIGERCSTLHGP